MQLHEKPMVIKNVEIGKLKKNLEDDIMEMDDFANKLMKKINHLEIEVKQLHE